MDFAQLNILPGNRDYFYHHFGDNCSTRIRDIIDLMTDGQFYERFGNSTGRYTLRQHVRRHTWFIPAVDWVLNFWMGQVIDTPITEWDEMFLPSEVGRCIEDFWYTDSDGITRKLVTSVEHMYEAKGRPPVLDVPRKQWPRQLLFSSLLSVVFYLFFFLQKKNYNIGKILAGISMGFAGFVFGSASLLLYFLAIFTNHDYTYENLNMIFASPLLLVSLPLGLCYALTKNADRLVFYNVLLRLVWFLTVFGILIAAILNLFPPFYQKNLTDKMLFLPIALVFTFHPAGLTDVLKKYIPSKFGDKNERR
jgi:hypothetical protein